MLELEIIHDEGSVIYKFSYNTKTISLYFEMNDWRSLPKNPHLKEFWTSLQNKENYELILDNNCGSVNILSLEDGTVDFNIIKPNQLSGNSSIIGFTLEREECLDAFHKLILFLRIEA